MSEHRPEAPGNSGGPTPKPIPRDLPDQQVTADEDPWDVPGASIHSTADEQPDPKVPDTDEAGTGLRGAPRPATVPGIPCPTNRPPDARAQQEARQVTPGGTPATAGRSPAAREDT